MQFPANDGKNINKNGKFTVSIRIIIASALPMYVRVCAIICIFCDLHGRNKYTFAFNSLALESFSKRDSTEICVAVDSTPSTHSHSTRTHIQHTLENSNGSGSGSGLIHNDYYEANENTLIIIIS